MKKLFLLVYVILVFLACSNKEQYEFKSKINYNGNNVVVYLYYADLPRKSEIYTAKNIVEIDIYTNTKGSFRYFQYDFSSKEEIEIVHTEYYVFIIFKDLRIGPSEINEIYIRSVGQGQIILRIDNGNIIPWKSE
jgi:hypothetical protein